MSSTLDEGVAPDAAELATQLAKSPTFSRSRLHGPLLQFLASSAEGELKEVVVGHRFFERPPDYDPKVDPVVRVEMRRLRERVEEYYAAEGAGDAWRLRLPKGGYQLIVEPSDRTPEVLESAPPPPAELPAPAAVVGPIVPSGLWRPGWLIAVGLTIVVAGVAWLWIRQHAGDTPPPIRSIAILEFKGGGDVPDSLTIGLAGEIAAELSSIDGLTVISPQAASRAAEGSDLRTIARVLNADALLEGSVESWGGRLRLQIRIVRAADSAILWAQSEERTVFDPFVLQSEFATKVAAAVHRTVLRKSPLNRPVSTSALLAYRAGMNQMDRWNGPALEKAVGLFESAVAEDSGYAAAWAALGEAYGMLPEYTRRRDVWTAKALAACRKALELDPENANAWGALGLVQFSREQNFSEGRKSLLKALSLNPNLVNAQRRLGLLEVAVRRFTEAQQHLETAARLDPLAPMVQINLAEMYQAKRDFPAAARVLRAVLDTNPTLTVGRIMLAATLSMDHQCIPARELAHAILTDPEAREWDVSMASVLARCGDLAMARKMAGADNPQGAASMLSVYVGDWKTARSYFANAVAHDPMLALNIALDQTWLDDAEIRRSFEQLQERLRLSAEGG